jgi:NTE family protein
MAVPGIFAPVAIEGRTLGDGSLTRNVAVDIARQTCADVVIAVAVPTPPPKPEALQSPLVMLSRTLDVLIGANERQQLDTLGPQDVKIIVPMGDIDTGSFDRVTDAIPLGREAAEQHLAELSRYSLSDADYRAWRASRRRPEDRTVQIDDIEVTGLRTVSEAYVRSHLGLNPGDHVDEQRLSEAMSQVFDLGDFESVQYRLLGDLRHPTLHVDVAEKSLGPNILRFDIGLVMGTEGGNAFVLAADYVRPWVNASGGELHGLVQLGRTSRAQLSLFQPLDDAHDWFVEPGLRLQRSTEDVYVDNNAAARYDLDSGFGFLEAGRTFGTTHEVRLGVRSGFQSATREIAFPGLPNIGSEGYGGLTFAYTFDDRDREALATRGWLGRVTYFRGLDALGSAQGDYDRAEGVLTKSLPVGTDLLQLRGAGGGTFDGSLPFYDYFVLGGPISFPGLGIGQLRGTSYWATSASYLHKIVDINSLFGQSIYAGATLTAGDMSGRIDHVHKDPIFGAAFIVGGRTPLGPMTLSFATTSTADWSVLFTLGRPVEERNIVDADW